MNRFLQKPALFILTIMIAAAGCFSVSAQKISAERDTRPNFRLPDELISFIEAETKASAYVKADLNGDDTLDYIVILANINEWKPTTNAPLKNRPTLIIVRDFDGRLSIAARNEKVAYGPDGYGGMIDPYNDIIVENNRFSIINRDGTNTRRVDTFDFSYSPDDKNWRLIRAVKTNYDLTDPDRPQTKRYTAPNDFGKIDFESFDPVNFEGKGKKIADRKNNQIKMHEVYIFLFKGLPGEGESVLVPVKRQIAARAPLAGAMKALLYDGIDPDEGDIYGFIFGVKFVSAEIRNRKVRIDFEYDKEHLDEGKEFKWSATKREFFPEAVERTALQFGGVDDVLICIEGLQSYPSTDSTSQRECPKTWWK